MKRAFVSIITPTYNQERYVGACLESAIGQSYGDWEQIVVDDGSLDGTREVVRSFADPRIRLLELPHRGLAALSESYNAALAVARGDLIAILEGDDLWPADKLQLQVPLFGNPETMLSWGRGSLIDEEGRTFGERAAVATPHRVQCFTSREAFRHLTRVNFLTPSVTVMVRRSALTRTAGFHQAGSSLFVDLPTWLRVTATGVGEVCFLNEVLGHYRVYERQTSQRHRARMAEEHLKVVLDLERSFGPDELRRAGWDRRTRSRAIVGGMVARGVGEMQVGRSAAALWTFARALGRARDPRDAGKALLGALSVAARRDLLDTVYGWRERRISRGKISES